MVVSGMEVSGLFKKWLVQWPAYFVEAFDIAAATTTEDAVRIPLLGMRPAGKPLSNYGREFTRPLTTFHGTEPSNMPRIVSSTMLVRGRQGKTIKYKRYGVYSTESSSAAAYYADPALDIGGGVGVTCVLELLIVKGTGAELSDPSYVSLEEHVSLQALVLTYTSKASITLSPDDRGQPPLLCWPIRETPSYWADYRKRDDLDLQAGENWDTYDVIERHYRW